MHVGERPYVVVGAQTIHISTHDLNLEAMTGMLSQLLPEDAHKQLEEFGAVEHKMAPTSDDRFNVVAARGGDDIWIEIRRRRSQATVVEDESRSVSKPSAWRLSVSKLNVWRRNVSKRSEPKPSAWRLNVSMLNAAKPNVLSLSAWKPHVSRPTPGS